MNHSLLCLLGASVSSAWRVTGTLLTAQTATGALNLYQECAEDKSTQLKLIDLFLEINCLCRSHIRTISLDIST